MTVVRPAAAAIGWALLAAFVLYGSSGALAGAAPRATALPGISIPDIFQNVLLYIPFGTLGVWSLRRLRDRGFPVLVAVIAIALVYSVAMEILQMLSASRIASPLDVIANVFGAGLGALAADRAERGMAVAMHHTHSTGLRTATARYVLAAVFAAIVLTAWYPFDVTLDVSTLSDRTRAVRLDPWLSPAPTELWKQGARFFVLAAITAACLPGLGRWSAPVGAVTTAAAALAIDLGQLAMGSQPIGVAAFVSQLAGCCAGAVAALVFTVARRT